MAVLFRKDLRVGGGGYLAQHLTFLIYLVGSIHNFGINIIEPRQDVLLCYFHKDLEPGLSQQQHQQYFI